MVQQQAPGMVLLRPGAVIAAVALGVNDHLIKVHWPGLISGKLSDFAYCYLIPLVLLATMEWVLWGYGHLRRQPVVLSPRLWRWGVGVTCLLVSVHFFAIQFSQYLSSAHAEFFRHVVPFLNFKLVADPTDLIALPMIALAYRTLLNTERPGVANGADTPVLHG